MTSTLLLVLVLTFAVVLCAVSFIAKASIAAKGGQLNIDGDSVTIADSDMQDFLFHVAEKASNEINATQSESINGYAVA